MMSVKRALLAYLLIALTTPALAQPQLQEVKSALAGLKEYVFHIVCFSDPSRAEGRDPVPGEPRKRLLTLAYGRAPNKLQLLITSHMEERRLDSIVFDGTWQSTHLSRGDLSAGLDSFSYSQVSQSIAPPGRPYDTFFYAPGTGLFAGQDVLGTFTDMLDLFEFQLSSRTEFEGTRCRVYEGVITRDSASRFLKKSGLRAVEEALPGYLDMTSRVRLGIDPTSNLPLG